MNIFKKIFLLAWALHNTALWVDFWTVVDNQREIYSEDNKRPKKKVPLPTARPQQPKSFSFHEALAAVYDSCVRALDSAPYLLLIQYINVLLFQLHPQATHIIWICLVNPGMLIWPCVCLYLILQPSGSQLLRPDIGRLFYFNSLSVDYRAGWTGGGSYEGEMWR